MKEFLEKLNKIPFLTIIIIAIVIVIITIFVRLSQNAFQSADSNPAAKMFDYSKSTVNNKIKEEKTVDAKIEILNDIKVQNSEGFVSVSGFRDASDILDEIRFHIVSMKYKFHLRKITPPSQQVFVSVYIDRYGRVSNPQIISPDTLSKNSRDLILSDLLTWQFVQIKQVGETTASFPLDLKNRLQSQ
jgi:hypothetical protein